MLTASILLEGGFQAPDGNTYALPVPVIGVTIDATITSWAELAAMETVTTPVGTAIAWVEASTLILKATVLLTGTAATNTAEGIQRPADYNAGTNAKVWFGAAIQ